jgi:hypothetical protein
MIIIAASVKNISAVADYIKTVRKTGRDPDKFA